MWFLLFSPPITNLFDYISISRITQIISSLHFKNVKHYILSNNSKESKLLPIRCYSTHEFSKGSKKDEQ